ncbi:MAG: right-handed parallel beta-helix repeat-containing protein [Victivallales bacterium]|nr:right-handed parallel beta-helix repeat-containing protein [Victivallales bacterium]
MKILIPVLMICSIACPGIDEAAIAELKAGKRTEANVSWWLEDKSDNTRALQGALDSGAKRVIIPCKATPWISGPLFLRSNQEIILEKGAVLQAKNDAFQETDARFLNLNRLENVTISGYSASISMNRARYLLPPFTRSNSRHIIAVNGSKNVKITGLSLTDSGGDGICIANADQQRCAENILLKDLKCLRNFRQGLSVISAKNLTVENCLFAETAGAPPASGVNLEPENDNDRLENIAFRNCRMKNNNGNGFSLSAFNLTENAVPFSVELQNCVIDGSWEAGIGIAGITWDGPNGTVDIIDCEIKNTSGPGIYIREKSSTRLKTRFLNCKLVNTALGMKHIWPEKPWIPQESYWLTKAKLNAPIVIASTRPHLGKHVGDLEFINCIVHQNRSHPTVILFDLNHQNYAERIRGTIKLLDPKRPYLQGQEICYDINFRFFDADDKEIGWFLGKRWPQYTPIETNIKVISRELGGYYQIQKGKSAYRAILTPTLKAPHYRLGFRYKTLPDFHGHMLLQAPGASLLMKATSNKWKTVALHGVKLSESGESAGKIPVNISAFHTSGRINKIAVENWHLATEEILGDK